MRSDDHVGSRRRQGAGEPALGSITVLTDLAGESPVERFERGDLDYAPIGAADAAWIAYDPVLGPQLRRVPAMSTDYYGFDTTAKPFDDVQVRRAFGAAVDKRTVPFDAKLAGAHEVAFFPPFTGG